MKNDDDDSLYLSLLVCLFVYILWVRNGDVGCERVV